MHELVVHLPAAQLDAVSDALIDECQALSVAVADADAGSSDEVPLFGEPATPAPASGWAQSELTALFADEAAATAAATLLAARHADAGIRPIALRAVADTDWVRLTQSQFAPMEITPDFWVVPSWHEAPAAAQRIIRLDPGLAFGTGSHPTTRMCLGWIARHAEAVCRARVLDYGCGSGILAIAAALHAAANVVAVDIDPEAVATTRANAAANRVTVQAGSPDAVDGHFAVVLANILAAPLKLLAPLLAGRVAPGGYLVLAGILERQVDEIAASYAPWLALEVADREDGWVLMQARRR